MDKSFSIAVVEDDEGIRHSLVQSFTDSGYRVCSYENGQTALAALREHPADIIVLDILLPGLDGLEVCRRLRESRCDSMIIFLSSKNDEENIIDGLLTGGDDYLTKPFSLRELLTRIEVCRRRISPDRKKKDADSICQGSLRLNRKDWTARVNGRELVFTVSEFRIMEQLMSHPGQVFTREQLLQSAYPEDRYISDRNADAHIRRIRKKILLADRDFDEIETVYGVGYRYKAR